MYIEELHSSKKFLRIYKELFEGERFKLKKPAETSDKHEYIQNLIDTIYKAKPSFYKKGQKYIGYSDIRQCRFYLAEIFEILKQPQQAKEMFIQVMIYDLIDELDNVDLNLSEWERVILNRNLIDYSYKKILKKSSLEEMKPTIEACTTIVLNDINYKTTLNFNIIWNLLVKYDKHLQQTN